MTKYRRSMMVGGADGSDGSLEAWFLANFDVFTPVARGARGTETRASDRTG